MVLDGLAWAVLGLAALAVLYLVVVSIIEERLEGYATAIILVALIFWASLRVFGG